MQGFDLSAPRSPISPPRVVGVGVGPRRLAGADIIVLMVVNAAQAEAVLFGDGALEAAPGDAVVRLMATWSATTGAGHCRVESRGHRPALRRLPGLGRRRRRGGRQPDDHGGSAGAGVRDGAAGAGGDGSRTLLVGDRPGRALPSRRSTSALCGVHIAVAAEALSLAERIGVDTARMLDILVDTAAGS